jgi:hypothetical protein
LSEVLIVDGTSSISVFGLRWLTVVGSNEHSLTLSIAFGYVKDLLEVSFNHFFRFVSVHPPCQPRTRLLKINEKPESLLL